MCITLVKINYYPCKGFALAWNDIFGTNPLSESTLYSTVINLPSGNKTKYVPVTAPF